MCSGSLGAHFRLHGLGIPFVRVVLAAALGRVAVSWWLGQLLYFNPLFGLPESALGGALGLLRRGWQERRGRSLVRYLNTDRGGDDCGIGAWAMAIIGLFFLP